MDSVVVDTSVWIDWFSKRNKVTWQTELLAAYFEWKIPVYITAVILQEVLQGVREDSDYKEIKEVLLNVVMLQVDPVEAAVSAADLYRTLRKKGVTIRKPNDCLIAHYAFFYDVPLLHNDVDFSQIAQHTQLRVVVV